MKDLSELYDAILKGDLNNTIAITNVAVEDGMLPSDIINNYMIKAMEEIGARFECGKAFVPNLLLSARAMKGALDILKPLMEGDKNTSIGKVAIGTVKGDLHDIGKNLVASMFEGCGFDVINLGVDVDSEKFIDAINQNNVDIVCMSALLTTTMNYMQVVIKAIETAGLRDKVKIMVGGAPLNEAFAKSIGADGYSNNANAAVNMAKMFVGAN